jgi:hypothetical protein
MHDSRVFTIITWLALPTVMYGGYALLGMLTRGGLSPFKQTFFRAGHAHAGVLLLLALLYHIYIEQTTLSATLKLVAGLLLIVGILAQSGGFFLHMAIGKPDQRSAGTTMTITGAVLIAAAILVLVYGVIITPPG